MCGGCSEGRKEIFVLSSKSVNKALQWCGVVWMLDCFHKNLGPLVPLVLRSLHVRVGVGDR